MRQGDRGVSQVRRPRCAPPQTAAPEYEPITDRHVAATHGNGEIRHRARQLRGFAMRRPAMPKRSRSGVESPSRGFAQGRLPVQARIVRLHRS
jgi:hypothetical protein